MNYRKEKLRRHWMDWPPLPTSPTPCDDVYLAFPDAGFVLTYSDMKPHSEERMAQYDRMDKTLRDHWKEHDA